jgi:hypothetical protein
MRSDKGWGKPAAAFLNDIYAGRVKLKRRGHPDLTRLDGVVIMGGWAEDEECRAAFDQTPFPVHFPENPRIASLKALPEFGDPESTLLCDIGKTFTKLRFRGTTRLYARNFTTFPLRVSTDSRELAGVRRRFSTFLIEAIKAVIGETSHVPDTVAIAVPCPVSRKGVPLDDPVLGFKDWSTIASDLLSWLPSIPGKVWVLNNGELAGIAAKKEQCFSDSASLLVLGLGYGVSVCGVWPCRPK